MSLPMLSICQSGASQQKFLYFLQHPDFPPANHLLLYRFPVADMQPDALSPCTADLERKDTLWMALCLASCQIEQ